MQTRNFVIFAASFLAGGIVLGAVVAHAQFPFSNGSHGVRPGGTGTLVCVDNNGRARAVQGATRVAAIPAEGGRSIGVSFTCPS